MNPNRTHNVSQVRRNWTETPTKRKNSIIFEIRLSPATKKNSQQIWYKKTTSDKRVPFIVPSARFNNYQRKCVIYMPDIKTISTPINIKAIYYMPTKRRVDITNLHSALHDVLVHYKVIEDDNSKIVVSTDGSRVRYAKFNPRTEVEITDSHEIMKKSLDDILPYNTKKLLNKVRV